MPKKKKKIRQYDKKIFRIWTVLNHLDAGKHVYTAKLADEFNISIRSVQRDVELLNMVGFPVVPCGKGCYGFAEGFSLKRVMLSKEDASLLSFLYEIASSLGGKFKHSFGDILKKVLVSTEESAFYVKIPEGIKIADGAPNVSLIEQAIDDCKKIKILYESKEGKKEYIIDPLKIIHFDGFWYLLANADKKERLKKFRLDNLLKVECLDEEFVLPDNLKVMLDESVNIWFDQKRDKKVVLKIAKEAARFFHKKPYFPLQRIVKENKDGSLVLETMVSHFMEVLPNIMRWIPYVKVESPKELKVEVLGRIKKYLA